MVKVIALCALCACSFSQVTYADDERGELQFSASFPPFVNIDYRVSPEDRTETLPPGLEPCGYMVRDGVVYEIYARECGQLLGEKWAHDVSDKDPHYYPFEVIPPEDSVLPPDESEDALDSRAEPLPLGTEASILWNPIVDEVEILVSVESEIARDQLAYPSKRSGVNVHVLGAAGLPSGFVSGGFNQIITGDSIVIIRGSAHSVVKYLVHEMNLVSGEFTTFNSGTTYRLVGDLDEPGRWHVLMNDSFVLRTFLIRNQDGRP